MENIKSIIKEYAKDDYAARLGDHFGDHGMYRGKWQIEFEYFEDDDGEIDTNSAINNLFKRVIELENLVIKLNDELNGEKKNTN